MVNVEVNDRVYVNVAVKLKVGVDVEVLVESSRDGWMLLFYTS